MQGTQGPGPDVQALDAGDATCPTGGVVVSTNGQMTRICNGVAGAAGQGVTVSTVDAGDATCLWGGLAVVSQSGTTWVCNGAPGARGADGVPGQSVVSSIVDAGVECPFGGTVLVSATGTTYVCNGAPAPVISGSCPPGEAMTGIASNGSITCAPTTPQRVIRYNVFDTYLESCCWAADNNAALFGGVNPSTWSDGNGNASQISPAAETLRTLFNKKLFPGSNALVTANRWSDASSTNGKITVALLRVRNTTGAPIAWAPSFNYTAYMSWGEVASVALNGVSAWTSAGNNHPNSGATVSLSLPANQTSTVIWVVPSSPQWAVSGHHYRMTLLAFINDSLALPAGLTLVDDLDSRTGNLW